MPKPPADFAATVAAVSAVISKLRAALRDALDCVLPELSGARACGRALGLKHNLGWKVCTVATSTDTPTVLRLLPRKSGWRLVLRGLRGAKCPDERIRTLEVALDSISARLDRALLRAVAAGGLDTVRESLAMARVRTAARKANEENCGARAEALLGTHLFGPPDAKGRAARVGFTQLEGLRRLRPGPAVPLHHSAKAGRSERDGPHPGRGLGMDRGVPGLVADLSDPAIGAGLVQAVGRPPGSIIQYLGDGGEPPRGHRAVFGEFVPHGGTVGQADDRAGVDLVVDLPVAHALLEVWLHRSIHRSGEPAASLVGAFGRVPERGEDLDLVRLPLEATVQAIETPAPPRPFAGGRRVHHELVRRGAARLGRTLDEFRGFRVAVRDPPIGSRVALGWRM